MQVRKHQIVEAYELTKISRPIGTRTGYCERPDGTIAIYIGGILRGTFVSMADAAEVGYNCESKSGKAEALNDDDDDSSSANVKDPEKLAADVEAVLKGSADSEDKLWDLKDLLVPDRGPADTVLGELVRAFCRIEYRWLNDGDLWYEDYGKETAGPSWHYIKSKLHQLRWPDVDYDEALDKVRDQFIQQLSDKWHTYIKKPNAEDCVEFEVE